MAVNVLMNKENCALKLVDEIILTILHLIRWQTNPFKVGLFSLDALIPLAPPLLEALHQA